MLENDDANTLSDLAKELGGTWSRVIGSDQVLYEAVFPPQVGNLLQRAFKRYSMPHTAEETAGGIRIRLTDSQTFGVDNIADQICEKGLASMTDANNDITIASKIADGSLEALLDSKDRRDAGRTSRGTQAI